MVVCRSAGTSLSRLRAFGAIIRGIGVASVLKLQSCWGLCVSFPVLSFEHFCLKTPEFRLKTCVTAPDCFRKVKLQENTPVVSRFICQASEEGSG